MRAPTEPLVGQFGEPALHQIHPRAVGGSEVEMEPWMAQQPLLDLWRRMGRNVVDHEMDVEVRLHAAIDQIQEPPELDGPVALCHVGNDVTRSHIESCVEIGGTASYIVVGAPFGEPWTKREDRRGA